MDKNDFDLDFDFEKEYGFDPKLFLSSDDDFDYDQFLTEDTEEGTAQEPQLDEYEEAEPEPQEEAAEQGADSEESYDEEAYEEGAYEEAYGEESYEEEAYGDEAYDESDEVDFITRPVPEESEEAAYEQEEEIPYDEDAFQDMDLDAEPVEEAEPRKARSGKKLPSVKMPKVKMPDLSGLKSMVKKPKKEADGEEKPRRQRQPAAPGFFSKLLDLYMEPVTRTLKDEPVLDPLDPRYMRRKKREKKRIFKEVYLPAIIAGVALFLILSFVVGFTANLIRQKKADNLSAKQEQQMQADEANRAESAYAVLIAETDYMALGYDYDGAIEKLDAFASTYPKFADRVNTKKAEYKQAESSLVEVRDTSTIANLSFHVLVADPSRAFTDAKLGGQYNKNFVTTEEFSRILNQLYSGNYVLVDFNSFVSKETVDSDTLLPKELKLPQGKKPIMITETMVNYFEYMVDPNEDGKPDANGHGFANKLVLDENGEIKAAIVDKDGVNQVGNYDLVPILEDFIKEHPDFSYKGARATLAVTGYQGVFGYRTNTSYVSTRGQSYYDNEVAEAKKVVQALRDKGYTLASYTYNNVAYHGMSTIQIQAEMNSWTTQVTPVLGDVEVMVFARSSDIDAYSGTSFNLLYDTGFRYFLNSGTSPRVDLTTGFVKQTRLMVTGEAMAHYSSQFSAYFDSNMVLDLTGRGSTPAKS